MMTVLRATLLSDHCAVGVITFLGASSYALGMVSDTSAPAASLLSPTSSVGELPPPPVVDFFAVSSPRA